MKARLLVATNGSPAALGALRLALAISRKSGAQVDVLTVLERPPVPRMTGSSGLPTEYPSADRAGMAALRESVVRQIACLGEEAARWPIIPAHGSVGPSIARVARERDATLILLGVKPRSALERFSTDAALDVLHVAHVPVMAALPSVTTLPHSALVGVDFTDLSIGAADAVVPLLGPAGTIHLAHVLPLSGHHREREVPGWDRTDPVAARVRLENIAAALEARAMVRTTVHVFKGEPDDALLHLANQLRVDLIATGSHSYGDMQHAFVRSVSTALLRSAPCSVLVLPPPAGIADALHVERVMRQPEHVSPERATPLPAHVPLEPVCA